MASYFRSLYHKVVGAARLRAAPTTREASFFDDLGFTLDDIESIDLGYARKDSLHYKQLDVEETKTHLRILSKTCRKCQGKRHPYPDKVLCITLKYGEEGENVGRRRKKYNHQGCGKVLISLGISHRHRCIHEMSQSASCYYFPQVVNIV